MQVTCTFELLCDPCQATTLSWCLALSPSMTALPSSLREPYPLLLLILPTPPLYSAPKISVSQTPPLSPPTFSPISSPESKSPHRPPRTSFPYLYQTVLTIEHAILNPVILCSDSGTASGDNRNPGLLAKSSLLAQVPHARICSMLSSSHSSGIINTKHPAARSCSMASLRSSLASSTCCRSSCFAAAFLCPLLFLLLLFLLPVMIQYPSRF